MNMYSPGEYQLNKLSNFAPNEFEIDGVKCGSMEGFLQSLKYRNISEQIAVCALSGEEAKAAGRKKWLWKWTHNVWWQGQKIKRGSKDFAKLIDRAYMGLSQNLSFSKALLDTGDEKLTHSIGSHNPLKAILTKEEFVLQLMKMRRYLNELTIETNKFSEFEKSILLERCRKGDNKAMLELSKISDPKLANMWLVRAVIYGNEKAREILRKDPKRASNTFLPIENFIPGERMLWFDGCYDALALKEAGFDHLPNYNESYIVAGLSEDRAMVIGMLTGYESPDEDGFGMEEFYNYYVYDEFFHRIDKTVSEDNPHDAYGVGAKYTKSQSSLPNLRVDWLVEDGILEQSKLIYQRDSLK